jgi:hypothetical protein
MTLTDSRPHDLIRIRPEFLKPFAATSTAESTFTPEGDRTVVTWSMAGDVNSWPRPSISSWTWTKMIGRNFEKGLADMKAVVESAAHVDSGFRRSIH